MPATPTGLSVILDVIYNHLGPEGNYLAEFGPYFTDRHPTPWGPGINVDGADAAGVRRHLVENACYWVRDFHVDGLRLDAIHAIADASPRHILTELAAAAREEAMTFGRPLHVIAESHDNDRRIVLPAAGGGLGLDAVWSDDFHHAAAHAAHWRSGRLLRRLSEPDTASSAPSPRGSPIKVSRRFTGGGIGAPRVPTFPVSAS